MRTVSVLLTCRAYHHCRRSRHSRFRLAAKPAGARAVLRAGAWRRRRDEPSFHGCGRGGTRAARHRHLALSVPLYGARRQAARPAAACAGDGARRGRGSPHGRLPELPLIAGGKSFGGRMTSQAQAQAPLPGVRGLAFLGFPLHPAGKPSRDAPSISSSRNPDAVPARHPRHAGRARSARTGMRKRSGKRATLKLFRGRRSFLPRAGAKRPQRCASARRNARRAGGLDRRRDQSPSASAMRPSTPTTTRHPTNSVKPLRDT